MVIAIMSIYLCCTRLDPSTYHHGEWAPLRPYPFLRNYWQAIFAVGRKNIFFSSIAVYVNKSN